MLKNIIKPLRRAAKFLVYGIWYPAVYKIGTLRPIQNNKVLLLVPIRDDLGENLRLIKQTLERDYNFDIHTHFLREDTVSQPKHILLSTRMLFDMATAKYVFMDVGCNVPGRISPRKGTTLTQLWHACGAFKKFGFSTANLMFGATEEDQLKYPYYRYCDLITVSSPDIVWAYAEAMGVPESKVRPLGVARTDVFFDDDFIAHAHEKLRQEIPLSTGKKVILFAPTFRGHLREAKTAEAFSVPQFYEALSEDYILLIKHHPVVKNPPAIPPEYQSFAVDVTNRMSIEELLCVADICISDYSSLIFEYSLFGRPMIFFAYDLEEYFDWRGFYYDYDELTPGPVCKTNEDVIDCILHLDESFDPQRVAAFRKKFMSACDGHSTERILGEVMTDDLSKFRK